MKIINKTTLKELGGTFLITLVFLNSILMMEKLLRLSRILSGVGATVMDMAKIILYLQPQLLMLTIPMALLLSTLVVYGRMNQDNEIIVMRSAGMAFPKISLPVFILGAVCFLASLAVSFYIGPRSGMAIRDSITRIITTRSMLALEEGTFNTSFKDIMIIVKGKKSADMMEDIFIYDNRQKKEPKVLMARQGVFIAQEGTNIGLKLIDGYINITGEKSVTELYFNSYTLVLSVDADSPAPKKAEFTPFELIDKAREAGGEKKKAAFLLELQRRLSLPAVCLLLVFLGPPLSLFAGKSGKLGGLALGLFVFTVYYMLLVYGENLATAGRLPLAVGAWAATLVLGAFAGILFVREQGR